MIASYCEVPLRLLGLAAFKSRTDDALKTHDTKD